MGKLITQCPACETEKLHVSKIECINCDTTFEGKFEIPALLKVAEDNLRFILDFVKCSGSLKEMAAKQNISYPTLRNRLNSLIEVIEKFEAKKEAAKEEILQLLEEGKISTQEAAKMLKKS